MAAREQERVLIPGQHSHAISQLSSALHRPVDEVAQVYQAELDRISAAARIPHYLSVLATRRARAILSKDH